MARISELTTAKEWEHAWPALAAFRPNLSLDRLLESREELRRQGYKLFGLEEDGQVVSVAGIMIQPHVEHGNELWVHDMATLQDYRSRGFGSQLLEWLDDYAKDQGCFRLSVHTRIHRRPAHRFYQRAGLNKTAYVYQKQYR